MRSPQMVDLDSVRPVLSTEEAVALVAASRLFDDGYYAGLIGSSFGTREAAAEHWVTARPDDAAPHPLVEPVWMYPGEGWRRQAPDPLSAYLTRPGRRSPHPCYDVDALGPLEQWLAEHDPAELLLAPVPRAPVAEVVVRVPQHDLHLAVRWVRHLARTSPDVTALAWPVSPAPGRVLHAVAAILPSVHHHPATYSDVTVDVTPGIAPPRWPWLPPLLAALDRPEVRAAQALVLTEDLTIAAPVLTGHPVSAIERLDGVALPGTFPGAHAVRHDAHGSTTVLATGSWLVGDVAAPTGPGWADLDAAARQPTVVAPRALRWSIDIAAGAAPIGRRWGDWHFARSLGDALERLGQWVEIDHPETRGRATRSETDVVLTLRGLEPVAPQAGAVNLLWVISHPGTVTDVELADVDVAFAAGTAWAAEHGITPLLQCTDATRFHPGAQVRGPAGSDLLFVGNARDGTRPAVAAAVAAGLPVTVIGAYWDQPGVVVEADRIANADLPGRYASAGVVLCDHHDDMRAAGFVSNRVFDVLAVGGRPLTDDVVGLNDALGVDLPVWRDAGDVGRLAVPPFAAFPDAAARLELAERVVAEHSFDARASTLIAAALRSVDSRG